MGNTPVVIAVAIMILMTIGIAIIHICFFFWCFTDGISSEQKQKLAKQRREERAKYLGKTHLR